MHMRLVLCMLILHQFAQNASPINHKVRHVTIYGLHGVLIVSQASFFRISTLHNSKRFDSLYSMVMPCILLWYGLWKSLQLHSEMSITELRKIQSSSQTAVCEELVASLTYYVNSTFSHVLLPFTELWKLNSFLFFGKGRHSCMPGINENRMCVQLEY